MTTIRDRLRAVLRNMLVPAVLACVGACGDLTQVDAPDLTQRGDLTDANGAITMFNGAVRGFYDAVGGNSPNRAIFASALLTDELTLAAPDLSNGTMETDQRAPGILLASAGSPYGALQIGRVHQLQALSVLKNVAGTQPWRIGQIYTQLGYIEVLLAETQCSGIPLSSIDKNFLPVYGPSLTTSQVLQQAVTDLDSAVVYLSDSTRLMALAQLGRGRALLNLNNPSGAAAAVTTVPTSVSYVTEHSDVTVPNLIARFVIPGGNRTVADREGGNGLNFVTANDPRVQTVRAGTGADGSTPVYRLARIASTSSPNVLTTGVEARLIEAEAALAAGNSASWLATLNGLRATAITPSMVPLADPGTATARVDMQFRDRAFWLFFTGHRLGDLRRLVRQYGRSADQIFPAGPYKYGGNYGSAALFKIDPSEASLNPAANPQGCADLNP